MTVGTWRPCLTFSTCFLKLWICVLVNGSDHYPRVRIGLFPPTCTCGTRLEIERNKTGRVRKSTICYSTVLLIQAKPICSFHLHPAPKSLYFPHLKPPYQSYISVIGFRPLQTLIQNTSDAEDPRDIVNILCFMDPQHYGAPLLHADVFCALPLGSTALESRSIVTPSISSIAAVL